MHNKIRNSFLTAYSALLLCQSYCCHSRGEIQVYRFTFSRIVIHELLSCDELASVVLVSYAVLYFVKYDRDKYQKMSNDHFLSLL